MQMPCVKKDYTAGLAGWEADGGMHAFLLNGGRERAKLLVMQERQKEAW